jgi:hypothetical protein
MALSSPKPIIKRLSVAAPQRVLFVGNSYLFFGDGLHRHVRKLAVAAGFSAENDIKYKSATINGAILSDHVIGSYLESGKLRMKEPFEVVILQGGSFEVLSDGAKKNFSTTVKAHHKEIAAVGAQTALYMTHAYALPHKDYAPGMTAELRELYVSTGNDIGAIVLPIGLAYAEGYRQKPDAVLHHADSNHPSLMGTYLGACVVYASLYGKSPVGNSYDLSRAFDKVCAFDAPATRWLQDVAHQTVQEFFG